MTFEGVQTVGNKLIVHIPQRLEDTIVVGGKKLYFDGEFNEHFHKKLAGVVVGAPARLGDEYLFSKRGLVDERQTCDRIQDVIEVGDVVYLDWTVLEKGFEVPDENGLYWCKVNQVVARVREGRLIPYGSYALLREVWPADAQLVQVGGHEVRLPLAASGLVLSTAAVEPLRYQGEVVHVGLPLRGQPQRVWPGDRVLVDKRVCSQYTHLPLKMKMEGEEYLCVRQDYIEAVIEPASQVVDGEEVHYIKGVAEDKCLVDELLAMGAIARFTRTN